MSHTTPQFPIYYDRVITRPEDYHLARQSSQRRSRIYTRHGPVSSSSSGSSLTRRGRHGVLSIASRFRDTGCAKRRRKYNPSVREEISFARRAAASPDWHPRRFVLAFSASGLPAANRAGLCSPNPPISSSNERIIFAERGVLTHVPRNRRNSTRD